MYDYLYGGSVVPDMVDGIIDEWGKLETETKEKTANIVDNTVSDYERLEQALMTKNKNMVESTKEMTQSIEDDFVNTLENALSDGKLTLSDFEGFFKQTMTSLITEALRGGNGIGGAFSSLFGGAGGGGGLFGGLGSIFGGLFGGGGGGLFSSIGSIFGGFFANGGYLSSGKVGIVGENGPELISGPANITPMDEAGGSTQVIFNINSIDTQTGTQFLLDNKKQIEGIIQNAYARRGKEGIF